MGWTLKTKAFEVTGLSLTEVVSVWSKRRHGFADFSDIEILSIEADAKTVAESFLSALSVVKDHYAEGYRQAHEDFRKLHFAAHDARSRADRLMQQINKTWNPPENGSGGLETDCQTAVMIALAYVFRDFPMGEVRTRNLAVQNGLAKLISELGE